MKGVGGETQCVSCPRTTASGKSTLMNSTTSHKSLYFKTHSKLKKKSLQKAPSEMFFSPSVTADGDDAKHVLLRDGPRPRWAGGLWQTGDGMPCREGLVISVLPSDTWGGGGPRGGSLQVHLKRVN